MSKKSILLTLSVVLLLGGIFMTWQVFTASEVSVEDQVETPYEEQEAVIRSFDDVLEANRNTGFKKTEASQASEQYCDTEYQAVSEAGFVICTHGSD